MPSSQAQDQVTFGPRLWPKRDSSKVVPSPPTTPSIHVGPNVVHIRPRKLSQTPLQPHFDHSVNPRGTITLTHFYYLIRSGALAGGSPGFRKNFGQQLGICGGGGYEN
ncbi:hypothetical protein PIB30_063149 [Stylosanthes scabra]|uniref:Uncharacterized protein n=1 Tax=Stylosanthes scabra TaxID=79078 RepID=A0ABU6UK64_9FABA|nr:hypothetical protein [Stylosanthes scabra]